MEAGPPGEEALVAELYRQELRLLHSLARDRWRALLTTTLTIRQLKVLLLVHLEGPLVGHDLAHRLGVSAPTVSGLVDRLADRVADPQDRRVRRVGLTAAGERLVDDLLTAGRYRRAALLHERDRRTLAGLVDGVSALARAADCLAGTPAAALDRSCEPTAPPARPSDDPGQLQDP